jgi:hypothetical protein
MCRHSTLRTDGRTVISLYGSMYPDLAVQAHLYQPLQQVQHVTPDRRSPSLWLIQPSIFLGLPLFSKLSVTWERSGNLAALHEVQPASLVSILHRCPVAEAVFPASFYWSMRQSDQHKWSIPKVGASANALGPTISEVTSAIVLVDTLNTCIYWDIHHPANCTCLTGASIRLGFYCSLCMAL